MVIRLHANATTSPKIRHEIQAPPPEVTDQVLARRYGVSVDTIRRWRKQDSVENRSHTPHRLQTTLSPEQAVYMDWLASARALAGSLSGISPASIPDEEGEVLDDGSLRIFVELDGERLLERVYPPGSWAMKV